MGLRDLIFENNKPTAPKSEEKPITFPKENAFPSTPPPVYASGIDPITSDKPSMSVSCDPQIDAVMGLYESGFDKLNQQGYDFYEFYKAVTEAGADNPAIYKMALTMAKAMDPNVSKESLIKQSEYYLTEITNVYKNYVEQGKQKKSNIEGQKATEESSLKMELQNVQTQLRQLQDKERSLTLQIGAIDSKYASQLHDINCKLEANDTAKRSIYESINKVKQGINSNL